MSDIDPAKLKVVELRAELTARGLDSKGNKPVLVERLIEALEKEKMGGDEEEEEEAEGGGGGGEEEEEEESAEEEEGSEEEEEPPEPVQTKAVAPPVVEKEPGPAKAPLKSMEPVVVLTQVKAPEIAKVATPVKSPEPVKAATPVKSPEPVKVPTPVKSPEPIKSTSPVKSPEPVKAAPVVSPQKTAPTPAAVKAESVVAENKDKSAPMTKPESNQDKPSVETEEPMETDIKTEPTEGEKKVDLNKVKCKVDSKLLPKEGEQYPVLELSQWEEKPKIDRGETAVPDRGRKRGREESPETESPRKGQEEDEPEYDEKAVMLSWYDSDLNIKVDKSDFLSATPMHEEGFAYIWAGARASYGVISGQAFFEVKITKHLDVSHLVNEEYPHVVRVGWSVPSASMQLGEEALSFGYGGTAKVSCNNKFRDFGKQFQEGDVVGSFLDMSGDTVRISFSVNGQDQGVAFEVPKGKLNESALFPHVVTKNSSFTCNFGASDPWFPLPEGYSTYVGIANMNKETELVPGPKRPESKGDCEMLMLCGLSGCGKTYWANKQCQTHPERNYNILGTNNLIDKMKVMGLSRRRNYHGRWDELIAQCTQCLNKLLVIASTRRRNYILDQTNVYPSAQRRKMRPFEGFVRQAIVIVPSEDDFKQRCAQREQEEGKDVPESANLEMKGNFQLPVKGDLFSEVRYEDLKEDRARELVAKYNKEAADAGYGPAAPNKRARGGDNNRPSRFTDRTDHRSDSGNRGGGGGGGRYGDHNRSDNRDRGGWGRDRGGGGGGGWRDNRHGGGGGYRGRDGGGGGGWRGGNRDRDRGSDSRSYGRSDYGGRGGGGGYDRNRSRDGDRKDRWGGGGGNQGGSWQSGGQGGGWQGSGGSWQGGQGGSWQGQQQRGGYGQQQGSYGQTNTYNQSSYGSTASNTAAQGYSAGAYGSYGQQQQQQQQGYTGYGQQAYAGWNQAQSGYGAYQATAAATGQQAQQPQQQSYAQYSGYQQAAQPAQQQTQTQTSYSSSSSTK